MHQGLAGPHGDPPEVQRHSPPQKGAADEIVVAHRGAAERDQQLRAAVLRGGGLRLQRGLGRQVRCRGRAPRRRPLPRSRKARSCSTPRCGRVRVPSPGDTSSSPVARMATRGPPNAREARVIHGRRKGDVGRAETPARLEQHIAPMEILAGAPDMLATDTRCRASTVSPVCSAFSWISTASAPARHRGSGEDPHGLPGRDGDRPNPCPAALWPTTERVGLRTCPRP